MAPARMQPCMRTHAVPARIAVAECGSLLHAGSDGIHICSGSTPIQLRGVNWFGFESGATLPDGLWQGPTSLTLDFITVLRRIKLLGYNTIRLPMSLQVSISGGLPPCGALMSPAWIATISRLLGLDRAGCAHKNTD